MPTIRVYPQTGAYGAMGGVGGYARGGVSAQTYYTSKLTAQQQISNLQLQYERALWGERLETEKLKGQLQYGNPLLALQSASMLGGLGGYGQLGGFGGYGQLGGFGQNPAAAFALQSQNNFWAGARRFM